MHKSWKTFVGFMFLLLLFFDYDCITLTIIVLIHLSKYLWMRLWENKVCMCFGNMCMCMCICTKMLCFDNMNGFEKELGWYWCMIRCSSMYSIIYFVDWDVLWCGKYLLNVDLGLKVLEHSMNRSFSSLKMCSEFFIIPKPYCQF